MSHPTSSNKRISCLGCRKRKRKCDLLTPNCYQCMKIGIICHYPSGDNRRNRFTITEFKALQNRVNKLESLISKIEANKDSPSEVIKLLDHLDTGPGPSPISSSRSHTPVNNSTETGLNIGSTPIAVTDVPDTYSIPQDQFESVMVHPTGQNSMLVLGPTSVYKQVQSNPTPRSSSVRSTIQSDTLITPQTLRTGNPTDAGTIISFNRLPMSAFDQDLYNSVSSFFLWQYPSVHLFIHRESFLFYYLQQKYDSTFASQPLMLAIAALGASQIQALQAQAGIYYRRSKYLLFNQEDEMLGLGHSSITKIQTLICLALYDIIRGKLTSGWLLSGLAWRMVFDLGFESDPSSWLDNSAIFENVDPDYPFDLSEVKRRIYWGCFIADHFISLVLGRKPTLRHNEATVALSKDMFELQDIDDFLYSDPHNPIKYNYSHAACTIALVELSEISESMLSDVFGPFRRLSDSAPSYSREDIILRLRYLNAYNKKLDDLNKSMPEEFECSLESITKTGYNYPTLGARSYYILLKLSLNRPFIQLTKGSGDGVKTSAELCDQAIQESLALAESISKVYDAESFIPIAPLVYCFVLATSILLYKHSRTTNETEQLKLRNILKRLKNCLKSSLPTWKISSEIMNTYNQTLGFSESTANTPKLTPRTLASSSGGNGSIPPMDLGTMLAFDPLMNGDVHDSVFSPDLAVMDWALPADGDMLLKHVWNPPNNDQH